MFFICNKKDLVPGQTITGEFLCYDETYLSDALKRTRGYYFDPKEYCLWEINVKTFSPSKLTVIKNKMGFSAIDDSLESNLRKGSYEISEYDLKTRLELNLSTFEYMFSLDPKLFSCEGTTLPWVISFGSEEIFEFALYKTPDYSSAQVMEWIVHCCIVDNRLDLLKILEKFDLNPIYNLEDVLKLAVGSAIDHDSTAILDHLFASGIHPNDFDSIAVKTAIKESGKSILKYLIEKGASLEGESILKKALERENFKLVKYILRNTTSDTDLTNSLYLASMSRSIEIFKMILDKSKGHSMDEVLKWVISAGFDEGLKYLIELGCKLNVGRVRDYCHTEIFLIAMENGIEFDIEFSVVGVAIYKEDFRKHLIDSYREEMISCVRLIIQACTNGNVDYLRDIHRAGADLNSESYLRAACQGEKDPESITFLLENLDLPHDLYPSWKDLFTHEDSSSKGSAPFQWGVGRKPRAILRPEAIKSFIDKGIDPNYKNGWALGVVARWDDLHCVKILIENGATDMTAVNENTTFNHFTHKEMISYLNENGAKISS